MLVTKAATILSAIPGGQMLSADQRHPKKSCQVKTVLCICLLLASHCGELVPADQLLLLSGLQVLRTPCAAAAAAAQCCAMLRIAGAVLLGWGYGA